MNPRRILLTTDVIGGVWDFCVTLSAGLRARGQEVVLLALGTPSLSQRQAAAEAGAQLISTPLKLEWMQDAEADVAITAELVGQVARRLGADLVHANQFAAACADVDVPVVLTVHSDVLSWRRWTLGALDVPSEWRAYAGLVRQAIERADRVVAVSRFLADEVADLYGVARPIDVVHNGWPASTPSSAPRPRSTLVAGRLWDAAKNVALVAEAAAGWDPGPVYLAGESTHPDGGQASVPPPLQPLGFLPRAELDSLLRQTRLYISAARYDPFGLLPLQAALHGCQLLLSDIPSYREVWGDAATYFRSGDAADLQHTWEHVLAGRPSAAAFEHARRHLSLDRMVDAHARLYAGSAQAVAA